MGCINIMTMVMLAWAVSIYVRKCWLGCIDIGLKCWLGCIIYRLGNIGWAVSKYRYYVM